jgi:hypothetical protein
VCAACASFFGALGANWARFWARVRTTHQMLPARSSFRRSLIRCSGHATAFSCGFDRSIPFSHSNNASCVIRVGVSRTISAASATDLTVFTLVLGVVDDLVEDCRFQMLKETLQFRLDARTGPIFGSIEFLGAMSLRYQPTIVFALATRATCSRALRPSRMPISANVVLCGSDNRNQDGRWARRMRFSMPNSRSGAPIPG